ncbi:MAG: hypothetical protein GY820_21255 [Gammaproteobacteria bacterium]|nr:hypothetical protein [Gammaproteobacteria bacterium]
MIPKRHTHLVQDEVSNHIYYAGTYMTCKDWISDQPDDEWEQYGIVSRSTGRFVSFMIPTRGQTRDRPQFKH